MEVYHEWCGYTYNLSNLNILQPYGKVQVHFQGESFTPQVFDRLVYAIGGTTPLNFLTVTGMQIEDEKSIIDKNYETTVKGLYLLGDLANGMKGGSIVLAFNTAYAVAQKIIA